MRCGTHETAAAQQTRFIRKSMHSQMKGGDGDGAPAEPVKRPQEPSAIRCGSSCCLYGAAQASAVRRWRLLVTISACANLLGTYMIRPVVNSLAGGGHIRPGAGRGGHGRLFMARACCAAWGYTQTMVNMPRRRCCLTSAGICSPICRRCPCAFSIPSRHGDVMSYFTNDVDTISDALNNSFAMVIQSFIQIVGTLAMLFVLNWQLSLLVVVGYAAMFLYIRYSGRRSKAYFTRQQASLGELDGYIEEMVSGQKVVKVFNHEAENLRGVPRKERGAAQGGHGRAELCRHHGARRWSAFPISTTRWWLCWAASWPCGA